MRFELAGSESPSDRILRNTLVPDVIDSFEKVEFTTAVSEIWVTLKIRMSKKTNDIWGFYGPDTPYIISLWTNDDTQLASFYITPLYDDLKRTYWRLNDSDGVELSPHNLVVIPDQWTAIELHYKNGEDQQLYVNGIYAIRYPTGILPDEDVKKVFIGQYSGGSLYISPETAYSFYFKDIRIGTSRGQGDLFTANLDSDNSLSLWSLLVGPVSHIINPFLPDNV